MSWKIALSLSEKVNATASKRTVSVENGECVNVIQGESSRKGIPACAAVACDHPEQLALVLSNSAGVRVDGRPVHCPLIAMDTRGGRVSLPTPGGRVRLNVSYEASPTITPCGSRVCCLCHDPLGNEETENCPHCGRTYHCDCLLLFEGRCAACTRPSKEGR